MKQKECFHFTRLERAYGIRDNGLEVRLEENSKTVGDKKPKVSYSISKIGAIGLISNFYEVYTNYKTGARHPRKDKPGEEETYESIMKSSNFEDFLGKGMYLLFDGTGIENTGGNTGEGGIYDASTTTPIAPKNLQVGLIINNDTGEISYSKFDYIHFLMSTMTEEELSKMILPMQERYEIYYKDHKAQIDNFKNGNFSKGQVSMTDFCRLFKDDIDKSLETQRKSWELSSEELNKYNVGAKKILLNLQDNKNKGKDSEDIELQV